MKYCTNCKKFKADKDFFERHDRDGKYAWCKSCCFEQKRSEDYPKIEDRGSGITGDR